MKRFFAVIFIVCLLVSQFALFASAASKPEDKLIELINKKRTESGLFPLEKSELLTKASLNRAKELAVKYSSTRPNGKDSFSALKEVGQSVKNTAYAFTKNQSPAEYFKTMTKDWAVFSKNTNTIGVAYYTKDKNTYCHIFTSPEVSTLDAEGWRWPVPDNLAIYSPYNYNVPSLSGKRSGDPHYGIDISKKASLKVVATRSGFVQKVVNNGETNGTACVVYLEHRVAGKTYYSSYWHLKSGSITVKKGQWVSRGTVIGITGSTGKTNGAVHLHFMVSTNMLTYSKLRSTSINVNPLDNSLIKSNNPDKYSNKEICATAKGEKGLVYKNK